MKVYVDELPKSCKVCPCLQDDEMCVYCNLDVFDGNSCPYRELNKKRHQNCPLQLIADYTKQVRKEVCELIWCGFIALNNINGNYEYKKFEDDFRKFLDQIEKGE